MMNTKVSGDTKSSGFKISLATMLVILSLAAVLPVILFSLFGLDQFSKNTNQAAEQRMLDQVRSLSSNIEREIDGLMAVGGALATSPSIAQGDIQGFYQEAKYSMSFARANVILLDTSLQQLMNTRVPFGQSLPKTSNPEQALEVIKTQKPGVSNVFIGAVSKRLVFNITLPVIIDGEVKYLLIVVGDPHRLDSVLQQHRLPEGWQAAVFDSSNALVSTTVDRTAISQPDLKQLQLEAANGVVFPQNINDEQSLVTVQKSSNLGWKTVIWAPKRILDARLLPLWRNFLLISGFAVGSSILLGYLFQRPLVNLIRQILASAAQLGHPEVLPEISTILKEGSTISAQLSAANESLNALQHEATKGKALLDTLLEHVPEGITVVGGPEFAVVANSRAAMEMTGEKFVGNGATAANHSGTMWFMDGTRPTAQQLPLYRATRLGEVVDGELFVMKRPDNSEITIEVDVNPIRDAEGRIIGAISCWRDVTARLAADRAIVDSERRLRLALGVARMAIVDFDEKKSIVSSAANSAEVLGFDLQPNEHFDQALPRLMSVIHPEDRDRVLIRQNLEMDTAQSFRDEFRIVRPDKSTAWIEMRGEVLHDESGTPVRLLAASLDITSRKNAEEHLQLVLRELSHRAKNLLTIVQAIATQTARRNTSVSDFLTAFSKRIQGLSASHDLLVKSDWGGVPIEELVRAQLSPFGGVDGIRIKASGDSVILKADVLQSLGLAMHELATNATKYGALSVPKGVVHINWKEKKSGSSKRFKMSWIEKNGPIVEVPKSKGFGQVIIQGSLAAVVKGDVKLEYNPKGITWDVDAPMDAISTQPETGI
jgi:PAS domain S-box-containing protein